MGTGFQVSFIPLVGVLFTFPSRYSSAIGRHGYLALEGGPPCFPQDFSGPVVLRLTAHRTQQLSTTGLSPSVVDCSKVVRLAVVTDA